MAYVRTGSRDESMALSGCGPSCKCGPCRQSLGEWYVEDDDDGAAVSGLGQAPSEPDIVTVRGISVARQIAPQVEALLAAAQAAGISLSGGGYRSHARQIELRRRHCGPTQFDIFEKPSSQCTPPTARPGASQHERGLAIDFTHNGRTIGSRTSPAFQWLAQNASRFGLYNLPSEPWHWSVNGR